MTDTKHRQEAIEMLSKLISDIPVAMLVTTTSQNALRSRPMVNVNSKFDGDLWFFSHKEDPKVNEIAENPQVNVSFVAPDRDRYVSVSGKASLVGSEKRTELLWTDACQKWFPDGKDDPQLALLRVDVDYAEYWDEKTGAMKEIAGLVSQAFSGEADKKGSVKHEKIDWEHPAEAASTGD